VNKKRRKEKRKRERKIENRKRHDKNKNKKAKWASPHLSAGCAAPGLRCPGRCIGFAFVSCCSIMALKFGF
jgi:hypothetical protein